MRGDVLLDPGALGRAANDVGEERFLEVSAGEPAEDAIRRLGMTGVPQLPQLAGEASRDRLTPGLVAFSMADEEGTSSAAARSAREGRLGRVDI